MFSSSVLRLLAMVLLCGTIAFITGVISTPSVVITPAAGMFSLVGIAVITAAGLSK